MSKMANVRAGRCLELGDFSSFCSALIMNMVYISNISRHYFKYHWKASSLLKPSLWKFFGEGSLQGGKNKKIASMKSLGVQKSMGPIWHLDMSEYHLLNWLKLTNSCVDFLQTFFQNQTEDGKSFVTFSSIRGMKHCHIWNPHKICWIILNVVLTGKKKVVLRKK